MFFTVYFAIFLHIMISQTATHWYALIHIVFHWIHTNNANFIWQKSRLQSQAMHG